MHNTEKTINHGSAWCGWAGLALAFLSVPVAIAGVGSSNDLDYWRLVLIVAFSYVFAFKSIRFGSRSQKALGSISIIGSTAVFALFYLLSSSSNPP